MNVEYTLYDEHTMPDHLFRELKKDLEDVENNKISHNKKLAGNIENEFEIIKIKQIIVNYLESCAKDFYIKTINKEYEINFKLKTLWINKQKKYEFNPLHDHSGDLSFVCWIQIPYNLDDELNFYNCKNSNTKRNSLFQFVYTNHLGVCDTIELLIDKSWEGKCIFFDAKLKHQVYPFYTSDDYRISISGNFVAVKDNNNKVLNYN